MPKPWREAELWLQLILWVALVCILVVAGLYILWGN